MRYWSILLWLFIGLLLTFIAITVMEASVRLHQINYESRNAFPRGGFK